MVRLVVNGVARTIEVDRETPLLWVLREQLGLTGTKFGCGMALCGVCTVHVDGEAVRSCVTRVGEVDGSAITTIEGLSSTGMRPVQDAWIELNVAQCGYCQPGQVMAAAALLRANPTPSDADIDSVMSANLCRCGTYPRIRRAIHRASDLLRGRGSGGR